MSLAGPVHWPPGVAEWYQLATGIQCGAACVVVVCGAGGAHIDLVPYRYLFQVDGGHFCLGIFDNGYQGTLLGGIITRNMLVTVSHSCIAWLQLLMLLPMAHPAVPAALQPGW